MAVRLRAVRNHLIVDVDKFDDVFLIWDPLTNPRIVQGRALPTEPLRLEALREIVEAVESWQQEATGRRVQDAAATTAGLRAT